MKINKNSVLLSQDLYINAQYANKEERLSTKINSNIDGVTLDSNKEATLNQDAVFIEEVGVEAKNDLSKTDKDEKLKKLSDTDYKEFLKEKVLLLGGFLKAQANLTQKGVSKLL